MSLIDYRGNCHCGAFKFTFKAPELKQGHACTCSFCSKNGYLWGFPAADFAVVKGDEDTTLKTYEFGKRTMAHKFCPNCGTTVLARLPSADGSTKVGINIRALQDVDFDAIEVVTNTKGASTEPLYQVPEPVATGTVPEGSTVYNGSCHCGAVRYALVNPTEITEASGCDCSICWRDGALWIYPATTLVTFAGLEESAAEYTFGRNLTYHGFCKTCGVSLFERFVDDNRDFTALNVRTMNGLDIASLKLTMQDGKSDLPLYEV
ncbi:glutathione-dependent formaldehyde-activating enzyme [Mycena alexandri]|uniref:Glutathione-dependent formaldehyde-activating enzyme n=1 Tax=Mycena alexandri TaxID=1745969 RepID=A0AAD6SVD2_9AGAR|nr:glutathione-dependent formaldehyde-activating enzyme [Mycena alexandri]